MLGDQSPGADLDGRGRLLADLPGAAVVWQQRLEFGPDGEPRFEPGADDVSGGVLPSEITGNAAMVTTLMTFARRLIAPWRCQLSISGPKTLWASSHWCSFSEDCANAKAATRMNGVVGSPVASLNLPLTSHFGLIRQPVEIDPTQHPRDLRVGFLQRQMVQDPLADHEIEGRVGKGHVLGVHDLVGDARDAPVRRPLARHLELLGQYTDEDMHDVVTYLHTLR